MQERLVAVIGVIAAAGLAWFAIRPPLAILSEGDARVGRPPDLPRSANSSFNSLPVRRPIDGRAGQLFSAQGWGPPAAPPTATLIDNSPTPPPNPYRVAGVLVRDGMARVLLSKGDRIVEADLAQQLDDGYRVEEIAADHVVLVYLPLGFRDSLPYRSLLDAEVAPSVAKPLGSQASAEEAKEVHAAKPADVHWEGPAQVRAGAMFDVTLHVNSEQPLSAAPLEVRYERDVLQPVNIRPGNVFASGTFNYRINPDGLIQVGASGKATAPSVDADVVVLTFKPVKSAAAAEVKLSSLALEGVEGKRVPHAGLVNFRTRVE